MKGSKRILSFGLSALMAFSCTMPAWAAPDAPQCDETLYVTMDPYGGMKETSVVKSYSMNGSQKVVDYGTYGKITNMTDSAQPVVGSDGSVTFQLAKPEDRFYFEGQTDTKASQLPWTIKVSYKLNGVEKKAEELAGASGLVDIHMDLVPNKQVSDYYRNNMVLSAATVVDMDKNLSLEADGAQVQAVGNLNAVAFFTLPGEERHYDIRIGTNHFSFTGLIFMMVPLKVSQLDKVADLRDARDTIKDSADAISDSLDVMLNTMEHMEGSIGQTANGLRDLDQARKIFQASKGKVYENADQALAAIKDLSSGLKPFTQHAKEAQDALNEINSNLNDMVATLDDFSPQLGVLHDNVLALRDDLDQIKTILNSPEVSFAAQGFQQLLLKTMQDLKGLEGAQTELNGGLQGLEAAIGKLLAGSSTLGGAAQALSDGIDKGELKQNLEDITALLSQYSSSIDPQNAQADIANLLTTQAGLSLDQVTMLAPFLKALVTVDPASGAVKVATSSNAIDKAIDKVLSASGGGQGLPITPDMAQALHAIIQGVSGSVGNTALTGDLAALVQSTGQLLSLLDAQKGVANHSMESLRDLASTAAKLCGTADDLISNVDSLNNTINKNHANAIAALEDAKTMVNSASKTMDTLYVFLTSLESQMKTMGAALNSGTQKTLNGLADSLDTANQGLAQTGIVRNAKDTIKKMIDDKWDEYTGKDTTILNADKDAPPVSFTSDKNPAPRSIQVMLRTDEIKADKDNKKAATVDESYHPDGNVFHRIGNIFKKIWGKITGLF